eukprot:scaffold2575_cov214-Alexandrium_tamarense.AAC.12
MMGVTCFSRLVNYNNKGPAYFDAFCVTSFACVQELLRPRLSALSQPTPQTSCLRSRTYRSVLSPALSLHGNTTACGRGDTIDTILKTDVNRASLISISQSDID